MILSLKYQNNLIEAGCDEAGRGCLAGPVVAAAVILPDNFHHPLLNDSKKVTTRNRLILKEYIQEHAIAWAVARIEPAKIDSINILNASFLAMHKAIHQLKTKPGLLLIDGNRFTPYPDIPHVCIVKGDAKFMTIAAASILAKTYRDEIMEKLSVEFPVYDWKQNKGYPTEKHRISITTHGATFYHRKTFNLVSKISKTFIE